MGGAPRTPDRMPSAVAREAEAADAALRALRQRLAGAREAFDPAAAGPRLAAEAGAVAAGLGRVRASVARLLAEAQGLEAALAERAGRAGAGEVRRRRAELDGALAEREREHRERLRLQAEFRRGARRERAESMEDGMAKAAAELRQQLAGLGAAAGGGGLAEVAFDLEVGEDGRLEAVDRGGRRGGDRKKKKKKKKKEEPVPEGEGAGSDGAPGQAGGTA